MRLLPSLTHPRSTDQRYEPVTRLLHLYQSRHRGEDVQQQIRAAEAELTEGRGRVTDHWGRQLGDENIGLLRTDKGQLYLRWSLRMGSGVPEVDEGLWRVRALADESNDLLSTGYRRVVAHRLTATAIALMTLTILAAEQRGEHDGHRVTKEQLAAAARPAHAELDRTHAMLHGLLRAQRQTRYLSGMFAGLCAVAGLAVGAGHLSLLSLNMQRLTAAVAAGGAGAVISVLIRIYRGSFRELEPHTPVATAFLLGAFRPLIGAVLAAAVVLAVDAGLVPLSLPDGAKGDALIVIVAFLAGFSERWAQMMLHQAQESVAPETAEPPSAPGPSPSTAQHTSLLLLRTDGSGPESSAKRMQEPPPSA